MFKRLITLCQEKGHTYYPEYTISSFPHISYKEMKRIIKNNPLPESFTRANQCHIIINGTRVSLRRVKLLIKLLPDKELMYWWNGRKLIAQDEKFYYDLREYLPNRAFVTVDDVIYIPKM